MPLPSQEVQEETQEFLGQMQRKEEEAEAKAQQLAETKRHLQELVERLQAAIIEEELSGPHVRMPASRAIAPSYKCLAAGRRAGYSEESFS